MITLLSAPLPIAHSLLSPTLPEIAALASILLITLAMAGTVKSVNSTSASKPQNLTKPSLANRVIETPAYKLAMLHLSHKKYHRHAALLLKQIGPYDS
jgi:hypothetical protein